MKLLQTSKLDLSDSLNGAGGVGGLLAVSSGGVFYFPIADNNGNVVKYINENGQVVAQCEYDDFGRILSLTGTHSNLFNFWASTKYLDKETGLYYYGYRFYSPALRCWLTRDQLGEVEGGNLYLFVRNNFIAFFDGLGLRICIIKNIPGIEPIGGWGNGGRNTAETHYRIPDVGCQKINYTNGMVGYKVTIMPPISIVNIYFQRGQQYPVLMAYEEDHINLIRRCDAAIESFKEKVEQIYACPKPAEKKLSKYLDELYKAYEEFESSIC